MSDDSVTYCDVLLAFTSKSGSKFTESAQLRFVCQYSTEHLKITLESSPTQER
jgi:hypothetical protein